MILSISINGEDYDYVSSDATSDLWVEAIHNDIPYDVKGYRAIKNSISYIYLLLPCNVDIKNIAVTFSTGEVQTFDFSEPLSFSLISTSNSAAKDYVVEAMVSDLPSFFLEIDESQGAIREMNMSRDHSVFCNGDFYLSIPKGKEDIYGTDKSGSMEIRGRGNATWGLEKKPYQFRTEDKVDLFNMGEARTWILLANHGDRSLLRSAIAYDLAHETGLEYSIEWQYVDLFMNGEYLGNYMLCEKVQVNEERVDVGDDGYLLEYDTRGGGERYYIRAPLTSQNVVVKDPETMTKALYETIQAYIIEMENAIGAADGYNSEGKHYTEYLDIESAIKVYWINELVKNGDYGMGSTFFYKENTPTSILYHGPVWDFDIVIANATSNFGAPTWQKSNNLASPTGWWLRMLDASDDEHTSVSIQRHLFKHADYQTASVDLYFSTIRKAFQALLDKIDYYEEYLAVSSAMNFIKWNVLQSGHTWQTPNTATTYAGEVKFVYDFIKTRIEWIDEAMLEEYYSIYNTEYVEPAEETQEEPEISIESIDTLADEAETVKANYTWIIFVILIILLASGGILFIYFNKKKKK